MSPRQTTYICVPLSTLFWIKPSPCHQGKQQVSRLHKHYSYMVYQGFTDTVLMASHCPTVHKVFYKWHYPLLPIKQRKTGKDSDIWVLYRSSPTQINKENDSWTSIHCLGPPENSAIQKLSIIIIPLKVCFNGNKCYPALEVLYL